ncbi:hypothetical protein [Geopsychrobacter electrodiphilus]|uniref:hypothetical protein n=1 Tax=Geopsychrobacter electrodiphilus TaxID=225196 RepID=UPI00037FE553|nr:hypothetical protein [Geopsychrobacter electrodiphilus]
MEKINLFIFAAHHSSGNIASQRFKSLTKYLDKDIYNIHILTRRINGNHRSRTYLEDTNVTVHTIDGDCVGKHSSPLVVLIAFLSAFFNALPFSLSLRSSWIVNALVVAEGLCRDFLARGEKCFIIGTYSPIDALICSCCLSAKVKIPFLQDFRDGFVFESLGRKGAIASRLRPVVEKKVVGRASLVASVSSALVEDFRQRYPDRRIELLPNGYDPAEFTTLFHENISSEAQGIIADFPKGKIIIGHFGRVSASDQSSLKAFNHLIKFFNSAPQLLNCIHVMFAGNLTFDEMDLLNSLGCSHRMVPHIDRNIALELMVRCDVLLLITGDRVGCATGKLFEYMATGLDIACFSVVWNEAGKILESSNCGRIFLGDDNDRALAFFEEIISENRSVPILPRKIAKYSRKYQAAILSSWIQELCP